MSTKIQVGDTIKFKSSERLFVSGYTETEIVKRIEVVGDEEVVYTTNTSSSLNGWYARRFEVIKEGKPQKQLSKIEQIQARRKELGYKF